jgi:NodT family efflux transporter outer membrane factor (OMF) lipoprotein
MIQPGTPDNDITVVQSRPWLRGGPIVVCWSLLLIAGCAVGPNFKKPPAPQANSYTSGPLSPTTSATNVPAGERQHFVTGLDISGEWWTLFHSQPLNTLIERSLRTNANLKAAEAALAVARELKLAQKGSYYPAIAGGFAAARQKTSEDISPTPNSGELYFSLYTPEVSVSYMPDVFGLQRRTMESLEAQAEMARFELTAAHITLSANIAAAAIQEATLRGQIEATIQLVGLNSNMLQIVRRQFATGYVNRLEVAALEAQLAQVVATLPPLRKQLAQTRDLLAALSGALPGEPLAEKFELASLQLPGELPVSLPSKLVEQRPDVRQAEANLHVASAQIGIAVANRLPNLALTANAGTMALEAGQILAGGAGFWTLAADLTQPIFAGGALLHKERAARAAYVQAAEQYRAAVLNAFQNVADTLNALEEDAETLQAAAAAEVAAKVSLDLVTKQVQTGYTGYIAVLTAQATYQQALITLVQAKAARFADTVALFQALGGGWWHRAELADN